MRMVRGLSSMRKLIKDHRTLMLFVVLVAVAAIAAPTLAGTVYSWTTEDGTSAFTDDPKRIPAKYRGVAKQRELGPLEDYPRYTESKVKSGAAPQERLEARLEDLRGAGSLPAVSAGPPRGQQPAGVRYGLGLNGRGGDLISFPVDETSDEPIVTSEHRIRTRNSIATQDVIVTKQGDKVISVRVGAPNQRKVSERRVDLGELSR